MTTEVARDIARQRGSGQDHAILEVVGLTVEYRLGSLSVHAVTDAAMSVRPGEVLGIIGETGSGKSTVVRSMLRLLPRSAVVRSGRVMFADKGGPVDLIGCSRRVHQELRGTAVAFVPQDTSRALSPVSTVWRQFQDTFRAHGLPGDRHQWQGRVEALLEELSFEHPKRVLALYPHELSGGMAQRVVLALAIALDPALLIADEPTSGLDASSRQRVLLALNTLSRDRGCAVVIVTHDVGVVRTFCDDAVVMYGGFVVETGEAAALVASPLHPYTRALMGSIPRRGQPLRPLKGRAGSLLALPQGCAFFERCPGERTERCADERPPLTERSPGRFVASFCE